MNFETTDAHLLMVNVVFSIIILLMKGDCIIVYTSSAEHPC